MVREAGSEGFADDGVKVGPAARALVADAREVRSRLRQVVATAAERESTARSAFKAARECIVEEQLAATPIGRLRETTRGGPRLGAIEAAGITNVAQAEARGRYGLEAIPGVGPQTAAQVIAAARQLRSAIGESLQFRFDIAGQPKAQTELLQALQLLETSRSAVTPIRNDLRDVAGSLDKMLTPAGVVSSRFKMFFVRGRKRQEVLAAVARLDDLMQSDRLRRLQGSAESAAARLDRAPLSSRAVWRDYEERVVVHNGLLVEVGGLAPDLESAHGFLPADIARAVSEHPLDTSALKVSLRGYQAFGAKFALTQGRSILGDEMGLGKTIEALAVISHLESEGSTHFLVVCPASVLVNWVHEIDRHSTMRAYRVHGNDRERNLALWARGGGIAVTTFESLRVLHKPEDVQLELVVVDEAHFVKNPGARRTHAVRRWLAAADNAVFLTGTPMENRVEEFRALVGHLNPDVASRLSALDSLAGAAAFRKAVAPVYLRRNQTDVLQELPPRIETEEWVDLESDDLLAYRDAVASGNFMAMRQAAYAPATRDGSAKLERLLELVEEATSGGRKIVIFSFFRQVLSTIADALDELAMGPLTGSVAPIERQKLVDEFSARRGPAVLVSQIQAGGVGLNMQAASVVILTEPQWKPTTEDQAIARCHRMGQARPVDVHRLLGENTVDQRMLEILARKEVLFDEYVRKSELKESSTDAVDISHVEVAREVANQVELERRIVELERRRLGLEPIAAATDSAR